MDPNTVGELSLQCSPDVLAGFKRHVGVALCPLASGNKWA